MTQAVSNDVEVDKDRDAKITALEVAAKAALAACAQMRTDPNLPVSKDLAELAGTIASSPDVAYAALLQLVHSAYEAENDLHNLRVKKLESLQAAKAECPADLEALDAVKG